MGLSEVKKGNIINYIGDSLAFGGTYTVFGVEDTYRNYEDIPKGDVGKLVVIEFMNDGTPMFFPIDSLDEDEWEVVK